MSEFDWVAARSECTAEKVFQKLALDVKKDLAAHGERSPELAQCLEYKSCEGKFYILTRALKYMVRFNIKGARIQIWRVQENVEERILLNLSVCMNADGDCVLADQGGEILHPWQVRCLALEEAFFQHASFMPEKPRAPA